jgi:hypothetical protein
MEEEEEDDVTRIVSDHSSPVVIIIRLDIPVYSSCGGGAGAVTLAEVLASGTAPNLEYLHGPSCAKGLGVLASAITQGKFPKLQGLRLYGPIGDAGAIALAEALTSKDKPCPCPGLRSLYLANAGVGGDGARAIAKAVRAGGMPELREFHLS